MTEETKGYHHGDLRRALLEAAEAELAEAGVEGFSLRKVARRAGVSHAAPAHHFGSAAGLLTALAAHGFRTFVAFMKEAQKACDPDPVEQLIGAGLGYIAFARERNALFRLVFSSAKPDHEDPDLAAAGEAAFTHLVDCVAAITGQSGFQHWPSMLDAYAVWAMAHGLGDLMSSERMKELSELPEAERQAALRALLMRVVPRAG